MNSDFLRRSIFLALVILLSVFGNQPARSSMSVGPLTVKLQATSGETASSTLNVTNTGEEEIEVDIRLVDWMRTPEGNLQFLAPGSTERSCANWLTYSPTGLTLNPGEKTQVSVNIDVPNEAKGDHWAMLLVTEKPKAVDDEEQEVSTRVTVNYAVKIVQKDPQNNKKNAKITNIKVTKKSPISLSIIYENSGPTHLQSSGTVEIRNIRGETIKEYEIEEFPTLPGEEHKIEVTDNKNPDPLEPGTYYAVVVMDYGGDQLIQGGLPIEIPKNTEESTA